MQRGKRETQRLLRLCLSPISFRTGTPHADLPCMFEEKLLETLEYMCASLAADSYRQVCTRVLVCVHVCVFVR